MAEKLRYEITAKDKSQAALRGVRNGLAKTGKAANLLKGALAGLGLALVTKRLASFTAQSIKTADAIAKTADKVGLSVRALQELRLAADLAGVSQEKFDSSIERFTKRIGEAAMGTGEAKKALAELNVGFLNAEGNIRPTEVIFRDVGDALAKIESPAKKAAIAAQLFGREGVALTLLLAKGSKGLDDFREIAVATGGVLETKLARAAEVLADRLTVSNRALTVAKTRIGLAFGQAGLVETFAKSIQSLADELSRPGVAESFTRLLKRLNGVLRFLIRNIDAISAGFAVIFGLAVIAKVIKFTIAVFKLGRAFVAFGAVIGLARALTSKFALAAGAAATAIGVVALSSENVQAKFKALLDTVGLNVKAFDFFDAALANIGLSTKGLTRELEELKREEELAINVTENVAVGLDSTEKAMNSYADAVAKARTTNAAFRLEVFSANDVLADSERQLDENTLAVLRAEAAQSRTFGAGARLGGQQYFIGLKDHAGQAATFVQNSFTSLERALSEFFVSGELSFKGFVDTVKKGLADIAAKGIVSVAGSLATGALQTIGGSVGQRIVSFLGFAQGGYLSGPGGDRSDNIPALLSPGEYVINAKSVREHGVGFFDQLNAKGGRGGPNPMGDLIPGFGFGSFIKKAFKSVSKIIKKIGGFLVDSLKGTIKGLASGDPIAIASIVASFVLPGVMSAITAALAAPSAGAFAAAGLGLGSSAVPGITASLGVSGFAQGITTGISNSFTKGILGGQFSAAAVGQSLVSGVVSNAATSAVSSALGVGEKGGGFNSELLIGFVGDKAGIFAKAIETSLGNLLNTAEPFIENRASGGPVTAGQPYVVGENGPELMIPGMSGAIQTGGGGGVVEAVLLVRDEVADLRRQFALVLSGGELVGAR